MTASKLQTVRKVLGYSAETVIAMLTKRAAMLGEPIMSRASLKTKLSRWENGHEPVTAPIYQRLFRDIYGRTNAELGFPDEPEDSEAGELRARLATARRIDPATVALFRQQVHQVRGVDRRFGASLRWTSSAARSITWNPCSGTLPAVTGRPWPRCSPRRPRWPGGSRWTATR